MLTLPVNKKACLPVTRGASPSPPGVKEITQCHGFDKNKMISSGRLSDRKRDEEIICFWQKDKKVSKKYAREVVYRKDNIVCEQCQECIDG